MAKLNCTVRMIFKTFSKDEDEATDLAYEVFDCQPSVTEKYYREVESVEENKPTPTDEERSFGPVGRVA